MMDDIFKDVVAVTCRFSTYKSYIYKCQKDLVDTLVVGDIVNVTIKGGNRLAICEIAWVDKEAYDIYDPDISIRYSWVISKVDTELAERIKKAEELIFPIKDKQDG